MKPAKPLPSHLALLASLYRVPPTGAAKVIHDALLRGIIYLTPETVSGR